ncbi:MAG: AhpC/TSA family protein [Bacteroidales bacterium]|nr:AhpC/TSA family protein [Bacteroidales bacterium]
MKKTAFLTVVAAATLAFCSCTDKQQFNIIGETDNTALDGKTAYLVPVTSRDAADSTVVANGKFIFKGKVESPYVAYLVVDGQNIASCIVEPGNIKVDIDDGEVEGTPLNDKLDEFIDKLDLDEYQEELNGLYADYRTAPNAAMRAQAEHLYDSVEAVMNSNIKREAKNVYDNNRNNILGAYAVSLIADMYDITYAELSELLEGADPIITEYEPVAKTVERLQCVENTSAGKHYTDVEGIMMATGQTGKLSDLIDGRLTLVDFWASWCGPCRAEINDNLVPLYKKYGKKGLNIVGLDVWDKIDKHAEAVQNLGITYPQLIDTTRTATNTYGVRSIPQIMLIGPDGTIIARDLRGAAIEEAVVKALAK